MGHGGGVRGQSLGPAQADRELDHLELIQHREGFGFAALDLETESRARTLALAFEDLPIGMVLGQKAQIPDRRDPGMPAQKVRRLARALGGGGHSELERFERPHQHPAGVGIAHRAEDRAHAADRLERLRRARAAAGDQIGMAADIFGERRHDQIGPVRQRRLVQGSEHRIVDDDDRALSILAPEAVADLSGAADVDEAVGRIGRRLEINRRDRTDGARPVHRLLHRLRPAFRRKLD